MYRLWCRHVQPESRRKLFHLSQWHLVIGAVLNVYLLRARLLFEHGRELQLYSM